MVESGVGRVGLRSRYRDLNRLSQENEEIDMKLRWDKWFYGIGAAIVGGGSAAVVSGLTSALAFHVDVTTWAGLLKTLSLMGINFVLMGIISMFFYLKQSPAPEVISFDTATITNKSVQTNEKTP